MKTKATQTQLIDLCNRLIGAPRRGQRILGAGECCRRLNISADTFCRIKPKLIAAGLRPVQIFKGGRVGYLESSGFFETRQSDIKI
jgi:hypothetical protein